jgi:tetratricopeptide (TPR) repeat protein
MRSREYFEKGTELLYQSHFQQAIAQFDKAIETQPDNFEAWHFKGSAWANLRKYDKALECYEKAISINPRYAESYFNLGLLYEQQNDKQTACTYFLKAEELGKSNMNDYTKRCK